MIIYVKLGVKKEIKTLRVYTAGKHSGRDRLFIELRIAVKMLFAYISTHRPLHSQYIR